VTNRTAFQGKRAVAESAAANYVDERLASEERNFRRRRRRRRRRRDVHDDVRDRASNPQVPLIRHQAAVRHRITVSTRTFSTYVPLSLPEHDGSGRAYLKVSRSAVHSGTSIDRWKIAAELLNPRRIPELPVPPNSTMVCQVWSRVVHVAQNGRVWPKR